MESVTKEERSKQIWVFRFLAILSVCCAHMPINADEGTVNSLLNWILGLFGTLGAGGFFLCSGYYFSAEEARTFAFWKRKILKLIVPWLMLGAFTKMWSNYIAGIRPVLRGYLPWVLGHNTWMYFVPVLIELTVLFAVIKNIKTVYIIGVISILSNISVILGHGYGVFFTPYMNPINWAIFFCMGLIWREKEKKLFRIYVSRKKIVWSMIFAVFVATTGLYFSFEVEVSYWTWWSLAFEISGILMLLMLSFKVRNCRLFQSIGKNTLFIFMTHMIVCGGVINHMPSVGIFAFMRPLVALLITYAGAWLLGRVLVLLHLNKLIPVMGICEK